MSAGNRGNGKKIQEVIERGYRLYTRIRDEKFFKIIVVTSLIILYGALAIFFADRYYDTKGSGGIFDAIYWILATTIIVDYGDIVSFSRTRNRFALMAPGVADSMKLLINNQDENKLCRIPVPSKYVGKSFGDVVTHIRDKSEGLLTAVIKEITLS